MKNSQRTLFFILGFRWISLILGFLFLHLKVVSVPTNSLGTLYSQLPLFSVFFLVLCEVAISAVQYWCREFPSKALFTLYVDLVLGILLLIGLGSSFFLVSTTLLVLQAFWFEALTVSVAVVGLGEFLWVSWAEFSKLSSQPTGNALNGIAVFVGEALISVLLIWLFLITKREEIELQRCQIKEGEEKELIHKEMQASQKEIERLYDDLLKAQGALEQNRTEEESNRNHERARLDQKMVQSEKQQEELIQKINEVSEELRNLRQERENLNFLVETSGQMHASLHLEETLVTIVETLEKVLPSQTCLIFLVEEENGVHKLYAEVAASPYADYFRNYYVTMGEGVIGWVAQEKEPTIIENGSLRTANGREFTTLLTNEKSAIVAPLVAQKGEILGVLYMGESAAKAYSWQDVNVLLRFTPHIQTAIAKSKEYHEAVAHGILDSQTNLYNRIYFEERLSEEVKRAYRYQQTLSLIFLQVDHYAEILSPLQEAEKEQIIVELAELLRGYLRDFDVLSRLEEGRFSILLVQADRSNAFMIAERIRLAIEMRTFGEAVKKKIKFTSSIGVVGYPKDGAYKVDLIAQCESALNQAILQGGNKTRIPQ